MKPGPAFTRSSLVALMLCAAITPVAALAADGATAVEALDSQGKVIEGFARSDVEPLTADKVRHLVPVRLGPQLLRCRGVCRGHDTIPTIPDTGVR